MDKKRVILDVLARKQSPYSLAELFNAIEHTIPKRTLRRLLVELATEQKILLLGSQRSRKYTNRSFDTPEKMPGIILSESSLRIYDKLKAPLYTREPCTYNETWLKSYVPNKTFYLSDEQRSTLFESGHQSAYDQPAETYANKIYDRLLIDLSYNSSRLEGNTYSLLDTKKLLLEGKAAEDKFDADRVMILNHKEAIRFLVKGIARIDVSEESIRTLHYLLSDGLVLPQDSGQIRRDSVKISGSVYIPLDNLERIQRNFNEIINKANKINNVFEKAFFLLVHFSYLQAFMDVNKQLARLSANIPLIKNNFVPISFNDIEKEDYQMAIIAIYELNQILPLADLFVFSYIRSCKEYKVTYEAMAFDPVRVKYRSIRRGLLTTIIKEKITLKNSESYIQKKAVDLVPEGDQEKFIRGLIDELNHIDIIKLAGLGVSKREFEEWKKVSQS